MNYDIPRITELVEQLTTAAQPYIDTLHAHPLYDEDFASGSLYIKRISKLDEEDAKNPLPFMSEDEYNLFVDCSLFWMDVNRVYTDAVVTKVNVSRQIDDSDKYGEGLISDPDAQPLEDVLKEAEEAEEKTQALMNAIEDLRQQLSLLAWVRYIESFNGNIKKIMKEIRYIASCVERPNILMIDTKIPEKGSVYEIIIDHEYFAGREPILVPHDISKKPFNQADIENALRPLYFYHLKALDYFNLPNKTATKVIQDAFTHMWSNPDAQHYNTSAIDRYYQPTDKVNKQITLFQPGEPFKIDAANKQDRKKGKRIPIYATLQFEGLEEALKDSPAAMITLNKLDPDDKQVLEGLVTIWENCPEDERAKGYIATTPQILYRAMTRNPRARISKQKELELLERVKKLRHSFIKIDAKQEAQAYNISFDNFSLDGAIVNATIGAAYINGNLVESAIFFGLPLSPLYNYAKATNRIASTPVKMLDTKAVNKNSESSRIEQYLVQRIETIDSQGNKILVSKIFDAAGIYEKDYKEFNNKRKRTIKKIIAILDGYVSTGYISEYHFNKHGRERYYSITFRKNDA